MQITITDGITRLIPDAGKSLTNGETYSKDVSFSKGGNAADWTEILDADIPDPNVETDPLAELEGLL